MSDSSENEGAGCGFILICGLIGCIFGPIGALVGIGIGVLLADGSGPKTSETVSNKEELIDGGLPYEIEATWNGVSNQEAELTIMEDRLYLNSESSSQTIPYSSVSTIQRNGKNLQIDLVRKDRTTISFPSEETTEIVEEVIFDLM